MVEESLAVAEIAPLWVDGRRSVRLGLGSVICVSLCFYRLPTMAYPHRPPKLLESLTSGRHDAVVLYTAELAHFAEMVPPPTPVISVLEEDFHTAVRQLRLDLGGSALRRSISDTLDRRLAATCVLGRDDVLGTRRC